MIRRRRKQIAFAIAAHPDDIEFYMAGTLLLLKRAGWEIHYMTLASGNCGSIEHNAGVTRKTRAAESRRAARILGAIFHPSLVDDLEIFYDLRTLRRLAAIVRQVRPLIVLTHSSQDYMEDHTNTCRLAVTAAFARGMPNFSTMPRTKITDYGLRITNDVAVYHAMPHGLRDELRRRIPAGLYINTDSVHAVKREALAAHASQKAWLDASQGMDSYLRTMDELSREVGRMSGKFRHSEGWRRHLHLGFSAKDTDPLAVALANDTLINKSYEQNLELYATQA